MKKYYTLLLLILFIPSLVFASWWNPFTWFSAKTSVPSYSAPQRVVATSTTITLSYRKILPKKSVPKVISPNVLNQTVTPPPTHPVVVPPVSAPPSNSILCNGTYYTACLPGQGFVCPQSGTAYCQVPQQYTPPQFIGSPPTIDSVKTLPLVQLSSTSVIMYGWISSYPAVVTFDIADNSGFDRNAGKGSLRFESNNVSTTITGLWPGATYYYRISAISPQGPTFTFGQILIFTMSTSTPFAQ